MATTSIEWTNTEINPSMKEHSHNYKGWTISSHGYKLVFVGKEHHLADIKGYAYEHRINAERKIGRKLKPGEQVHHLDENKLNNNPNNLEVMPSSWHHRYKHRAIKSNKRKPDENNFLIFCKCGCGSQFTRYDKSNRLREYISGHNPFNSPTKDKILLLLSKDILSISEISNRSGITKNSVKTTLGRMVKMGMIVKVKFGVYGKIGTPIRINAAVKCGCGCGQEFYEYDKLWRKRTFISGHNKRGLHGQYTY